MQKEFVLNEDQIHHINDIKNKWKTYSTVIDTSVMGTGKTITSLKLGEEFDKVIVVCQSNIINIWKDLSFYFNVNIEFVSYKLLTGFSDKETNNDFLNRNDDTFTPKEKLIEILSYKCLIIMDEFQELKNAKLNYMSCKELLSCMNELSPQSKSLLLSGTPYDKKEHVVNILQLIGIVDDDYNKLIEYCKNIDLMTTIVLCKSLKQDFTEICYKLYTNVLQKHIVSSMKSPDINAKIKCFNGYFNMSEEGSKELKKGIDLLHNSIEKTGKVNSQTTALRVIQNSKVEIYVRIAKIILNKFKNDKLTLFFDFDEPIYETFKLLEEFKPEVVNGKINYDERSRIISKFQEDNNDSRLIIFNTAVGSTGISLDDTTGNHKRWCLACPNYYIMRMHQLSRRFYRVSTKSDPTIINVYGICGIEETSIINSLIKKSEVMKETLTLQVKNGVVFPSDYEKYKECDDFEFEKFDSEVKNFSVLSKKNKHVYINIKSINPERRDNTRIVNDMFSDL